MTWDTKMFATTRLIKMTSVAAFVVGCAGTVAFAQTAAETETPAPLPGQIQLENTPAPATITEGFEETDPALVLGGQIDFVRDKGPWVVYLSNEELVMENRQNPQSLHYNDIAWVKFPTSTVLETTEDLIISAVVKSDNSGTGGAGILVGSGKNGVYVAFAVDATGRFHVLRKDGRQLRPMHSAPHPAILVGAPNRISFEERGANLAFFANGTEIIQIPYERRTVNRRVGNGSAGIGLAAFGIGTFTFDDVEISR